MQELSHQSCISHTLTRHTIFQKMWKITLSIKLVNCFSKIFTSVLNNRIMKWAECYNIINDVQFGIRKNRSTIDAIFILNAIVNKELNSKQRLYCAFIDMKAAFDNFYRNALWFKLHKCGINLKIVNIIKNVYTDVKSCVRHCNSYSSFFDCAVGFRQGEVLSPLMSSLFIDLFVCLFGFNVALKHLRSYHDGACL